VAVTPADPSMTTPAVDASAAVPAGLLGRAGDQPGAS
jgi:hypothetical protein